MKKIYALLLCTCVLAHIHQLRAQSGSNTVGVTIAGGNGFGTAINQIDPRIVALDTSDNLYVLDGYAARIFKYTSGAAPGALITGGSGLQAGIFTIDAANNFYVASGNRILKWAPGATDPIVAGNTTSVDLRGLGVDTAGNVYALDYYGNRVLKYSPGSITGVVVLNGSGLYVDGVSTNFPRALFVDAPGNIYVSDDYNGRILKFNQKTGITTIVAGGNVRGGAANQLSNPQGTFVDAAGNLYIADAGNNRIQKWAPGASSGVTVAGGNGAGNGPTQLTGPLAVCVSKAGTIYVADGGNLRVERFDALQEPGSSAFGVTVAGGDGSMLASGVHVDKGGNIYVADEANHRIQKFTPGSLTGVTVAGGNGAGPAANQLHTPKAVFVDNAGNMYIADAVNNRIQKWARGASSGITVAGGNGTGNAENQLNYPNDVFVDKVGNVYVSEYGNNRVTMWPPGAGTGIQSALRGAPGNHPGAVFVDADGFIYVSASEDAAVLKWINNSFISAVAGTLSATPAVGSGADELSAPAGVFVDANKTVYVADKANHRIQRWAMGATSGVTIAGGNGPGTLSTQLLYPNDVFVDPLGNFYVASGDRIQKFTVSGEGAGINYKYYEGTFNTLPDFNALTPVKTGISANVNLNSRAPGRDDAYAFLWQGKIKIPTAGSYTFQTISDDGSRLYFNMPYAASATPTVDNDGVHAVTSATGTVNVAAPGAYPIAISFFEKDRAESMQVLWSGPGIPLQPIPDSAFISVSVENSAPTAPQFVHAISKSFTYVNLAWEPATDNIGVTGYDVYVNGVKKYTATESHVAAVGLSPNTTYKFLVKAFDLAGNRSDFSSEISASTNAITGGLSYNYYEGNWNTLPDFSILTPVKSGNTPNVDIGVRTSGTNDHFAFVWEGYINIPTPGTYTFETISDDGSKLYFNSLALPTATATVNNDGVHAPTSTTGDIYIGAAGPYPIAITYFEKDGGENMQVFWKGPGIARQLIPDAAFTPGAAPPSSGLNYKYYEGVWNTLPDFSVLTPVKKGITPNIDINVRPAGRNDNFAFVWEGTINIPAAGNYTFETISDDGSRLYFNSLYVPGSSPLVNNDGVHAPASSTGSVYIPAAGIYPIAITFFEKDGGELMQVYWSGPGIGRQLIPDAAFAQPAPSAATSPQLTGASVTNGSTAIDVSKDGSQISKVYPDPFVDKFKMDFYNSSANNDISVNVRDVSGRLMYTHRAGKFVAGNNSFTVLLGGARLHNGLYFVTLNVNGGAVKTMPLMKTNK